MEKLKEIYNYLVEECNALVDKYREVKESLSGLYRPGISFKSEKLLEKVQKMIEREKLSHRIEVLDRLIENIDIRLELPSYDIAASSQNIIATPKSINNALKKILEEEYAKLDVLSTKIVLADVFEGEREKQSLQDKKTLLTAITAMSGLFFISLPISSFLNYCTQIAVKGFISFLLCLPIGICPIVAHVVFSKYVKRKIEVFEELNKLLGDEKLDVEIDNSYEEKETLSDAIEQQINKLMITEITQREYQANLDAYTESQQSQNTLMQTLNVEPVIDLGETNEVEGPRLVITKPAKPISLNED